MRPGHRTAIDHGVIMTTAYYSTVLNHPLPTVWDLIRDFNNYPAYIEGVSESVIEDDKGGDEVGAVRRFCYLGNWVRQRLAGHSDEAHSLTYAGIEPLPFPAGWCRMRPHRHIMKAPCTCCRSSRATAHSSNGRSGSIPRLTMPIAGVSCSSHGFRIGRTRSNGRWPAGVRDDTGAIAAGLRRSSAARRQKS
jgi:hypothetical protein